MAPKKKPTDELKDQRIPIMMSEAELQAIDDWSFANRIRSRGEAIRRLCQMAIKFDSGVDGLFEYVIDATTAFDKQKTRLKEMQEERKVNVNELFNVAFELYTVAIEQSLGTITKISEVLTPAIAFRSAQDLASVQASTAELQEALDDKTLTDDERAKLIRDTMVQWRLAILYGKALEKPKKRS